MKVDVLQEDIDNASFGSESCPIAQALKRQTGSTNCMVGGTIAGFNGKAYYLPNIAQEFIEQYDTRQIVKPISFELVNEIVPGVNKA